MTNEIEDKILNNPKTSIKDLQKMLRYMKLRTIAETECTYDDYDMMLMTFCFNLDTKMSTNPKDMANVYRVQKLLYEAMTGNKY